MPRRLLSPLTRAYQRNLKALTKAKEAMLERTHIPEAPWWIVQAVDKKRARLNCIAHLLRQFDFEEIERPEVVLPERERHDDYSRRPVPQTMIVPEVY